MVEGRADPSEGPKADSTPPVLSLDLGSELLRGDPVACQVGLTTGGSCLGLGYHRAWIRWAQSHHVPPRH